MMITANATNFRKDLYGTLEQVAKYNDIATVYTKDGAVVILNAADYHAMMETIYLSGIPDVNRDMEAAKTAPETDFVDESQVHW